jgi:GalNAc-alpha-(1->4)-GalNAc-alpha-(1->3)-diNAcBac-PP-undecaprenol alpha-1,4-N-acetyl-D-galactosaminyltransferase
LNLELVWTYKLTQLHLKNKICLSIPSLQAGGMERVMSELINQFVQKEGLEIHLVLYGIKRDIFYPVPESVISHKPQFEFNSKRRLISTVRTLFFLRKTIKNINPVSVLSFGEFWNNFVLLSLIGINIPVVVSDRCQPDKSLGIMHDFLRKCLYPRASTIVCQTKIAKEIYQRNLGELNYEVIGNPIREIKNIGLIKNEKIVLSVGRLIASKNFDKLISIFASIDAPDWKLVIVGDDALKEKNMPQLERQILDLKLEGRIILAGKQKDVDTYYNQASIFAFTSSSEGFPNVIGEAMSASLPVIAYDCTAGPADLISNEQTGFLIPLHNQKKFEEKLKLLMEDAELRHRFASNAQQKIKAFEAAAISEQFLNVLIR